MKKRIISLFLVLTLLLGMAPAVFAADKSFTDVAASDWYYAPVQWAVENGITSGLSETEFGPNVTCTRSQVVTFLWAAANKPEPTTTENPFSDVAASDWFYAPVLWAVENGITSGLSDTEFGPYEPCTRAQVVTFLYAAAGRPELTAVDNPFADVGEADWFRKPVLWAVENKITSGLTPDSFGANEPCTRGQIVTFLYAASKIQTTEPTPTPNEFAAFEAMTIYDFPEHLVLNFDEDPETNFGVLNEDVIRWEDKPITAEKIFDGEQSKYVFSDSDALKDIPLNSVVYVKSARGTPYLVSFGSVEGNTVTPAADLPLSAYYTYLDAVIVTEIDTAAMQRRLQLVQGHHVVVKQFVNENTGLCAAAVIPQHQRVLLRRIVFSAPADEVRQGFRIRHALKRQRPVEGEIVSGPLRIDLEVPSLQHGRIDGHIQFLCMPVLAAAGLNDHVHRIQTALVRIVNQVPIPRQQHMILIIEIWMASDDVGQVFGGIAIAGLQI